MRNFTLNSDAPDQTRSLVESVANPMPLTGVAVRLGEILAVDLFLASPSTEGGYDAASGDVDSSVVAAVGSPAGLPTSGTYTLSFNSVSTAAIAYNATATAIQDALETIAALEDNVAVTGQFPSYNVQFIGDLADASQVLIQCQSALLSARSLVSIGRVQTGSGVQNEIQSITLQVLPAVYQATWTTITNGWSGTLSFTSAALIQLFTPGQPYIDEVLEFSITDGDGNVSKHSLPLKIYASVTQVAGVGSGGTVAESLSGLFSIGNGADQGTVTGLNLASVPRGIEVQVMAPTGGLNIFATVDFGSISTNGFTFNLSGLTDATGYKLFYTLVF